MKENVLLKILGIVIACLLTLVIFIVQETRGDVQGLKESVREDMKVVQVDITTMKIAIATINTRLNIEPTQKQ